ncbi:MAG: hypothetical protein JKY37_26395 [Nannocystaceae bacterium]|nr:hypothetical protein [Nannocystaceae bacterium]
MKVDNTNPTLYEPPPVEEAEAGPKNEFLRLLVAQMQNQDPLNPQDGSEFVAQLAQFANLEIGIETNTRLAALESGQVSSSRATMMGLVGKRVTVDASQINLTGDATEAEFTVDLDDAATKVDVVIRNENGDEVARIQAGANPAGDIVVDWDGKDANGIALPEGSYSVEVEATSGEDGVIEASISLSGTTTSIEFSEDGGTLLGLGGILVSPAAIQSVANGT